GTGHRGRRSAARLGLRRHRPRRTDRRAQPAAAREGEGQRSGAGHRSGVRPRAGRQGRTLRPLHHRGAAPGPRRQDPEVQAAQAAHRVPAEVHGPVHGHLEDALKLLSLPRVVGTTEDGTEVTAQNGRYGPYLKKGSDSRSLETEEQLFTITMEEAEKLYAQPKTRGRA